MPVSLFFMFVSALYLFCSAQSLAVDGGRSEEFQSRSTCKATANWPGWSGIKYAFIFGDSYTQTGFNQTGTQPTPTNPLGNPTYPGYTASDGPNWVDYLTVEYNASTLLTYNLAYGGATIDSTLVAPYLPTVSSVSDQIQNEWVPTYVSKPSSAPWASDNTIFTIFDGINDVGNSWSKGVSATTTLNAQIFSVFSGLVEKLYTSGARNFAFINVPPVDRAPLTLVQSTSNQAMEKADITAWNAALLNLAKSLKSNHSDVNIFTVDANALFTKVLDNPASYPQTALYKNTTAYCDAYENGTPATDTFDPSCGIPVNEYFWLNSLHPTYPVHEVLAQEVARQLEAGPNVS
ncbi:Acetylesterase [Lachnellula occidentalis]|uniref:Acetylesterase n=1 Tax=Lachnellula occidentalis TaxID=215460 RepID=A0A8H8S4C9_9HELO|nr:Acetylesterase [Lachnellula occidentalis]